MIEGTLMSPSAPVRLSDLTAVVLCLNEEKRIARCVRSLGFVSKLVVIDSFSTDATEAACRQAWREVGRESADLLFVSTAWRGFTQARNDSLLWVKTPWVFWVDADEWVGEELVAEIKAITQRADNETPHVYKIPRQSYFLERTIRHGGWYPDRKARLGRSALIEWRAGPNNSDVHEDLYAKAPIPCGLLKSHLFHEPFLDLDEQRATNERYSNLLAEGLARKILNGQAHRRSSFEIGLKMFIKFVENYFYKLGILDGRAGFLIAMGSAKSLKMRLQKANRLVAGARGEANLPTNVLPDSPSKETISHDA